MFLLAQRLLLAFLVLLHLSGTLLNLFDALFDLNKLLQFLVVVSHQLIRFIFLFLQQVGAYLDQVPSPSLLIFYSAVPGMQGVIGHQFPALF